MSLHKLVIYLLPMYDKDAVGAAMLMLVIVGIVFGAFDELGRLLKKAVNRVST